MIFRGNDLFKAFFTIKNIKLALNSCKSTQSNYVWIRTNWL